MKREPEFDHGFHASIPRLVRTGYTNLTATQKWLYVCLKDLAGETGMCFRSIQTLNQESGISTGMISQSIHELHEAGLIHAEMKKRSNGGKPVWHITIADIWTANGKVHPTKRSLSEQTPVNVHSVNENIQQVNGKARERSHSEQERSLCETEEGKEKKDHFEEGKEKKIAAPSVTPVSPTTRETNSLSFSQEKSSLLDQLTDEQADFWTRWCATVDKPKPTEAAMKSVIVLAGKIRTTIALQSLYGYAYDRVKEIAQAKGREATPPNLGTLERYLAEWEQVQNRKQQEKEQDRTAHDHIPGSGSVTNWTQARLTGNQPAVNYDPLPTVKPTSGSGLSQVGNISAGLQERIRQAREKRSNNR